MPQSYPPTPTDDALERAARRYVEKRRAQTEARLSRLELTGLLERYGGDGFDLTQAIRYDDAGLVREEEAGILRARIGTRARAMARLARSGDPRYDLTRHIALDRLLRWLSGRTPWQDTQNRQTSGCIRAANLPSRRRLLRRKECLTGHRKLGHKVVQ